MALFRKRRPEAVETPPVPEGVQFSEPTSGELALMASHLDFATRSNIDISDVSQVAQLYDMLLQHWLNTPDYERPDPNMSITVIGTVFGEHLVRRTSLQWVVAQDAASAELALHGTASNVLVYPANLVAKRWVERADSSFIPQIAHELEQIPKPHGRHSL